MIKGTLVASKDTLGGFYLVTVGTVSDNNIYDEYITVVSGDTYSWERLGRTGQIAFNKQTANVLGTNSVFTTSSSNVTLGTPTTDKVLGENTTFTLANGSVSYGTKSKDNVLGEDTTFALANGNVTVNPSTTAVLGTNSTISLGQQTTSNIKATSGDLTVSNTGTADAITAISPNTTSITGVGTNTVSVPSVSKSTKTATLSVSGETLSISFTGNTNSLSADSVTIGTAGNAATKAGSATTVVTGLGTTTKQTVSKGVSVSKPEISLSTVTVAEEGNTVMVVTNSPTSATISPATVNAYTGLSASVGTDISVGTNDKVSVLTDVPSGSVKTGSTVGNNDIVDAVTELPTTGNIADAQTITITPDTKAVLTNETSVSFG